MDLSESLLGKTVARQLGERAAAIVLRIGSDGFDRAALARVACFNFAAAANLSAILNRELQVEDTRDVFDRIAPRDLALPRLGAVSLAVLGAAFEAKRIGGDAPLAAWARKHAGTGVAIRTFGTVKHQIARLDKRPRRTARRRR